MRDGISSAEFGSRSRVFDYDFESHVFNEVADPENSEPAFVAGDRPALDRTRFPRGLKASWRRLTFRFARRSSKPPN